MSRLSRSRGLRSRLGVATILLAGLASVIFYAAVSATINGEPSTLPFRGFVALLQSAGTFSQDQVKLMAAPLVPGGPGQHPALSYEIAVCGNQPFRGVLLIGGNARLSDLRGTPALGTRNTVGQSSLEDLPDLTFLDEGTASELDLGSVQAIHLAMSHPGRCASAYSTHQVPPPFGGQGQIITGHTAAPVLRQWRLGWWNGPRASQSWPLIGNLPGISDHDLGEFQALDGLRGAWARFIKQYYAVSVGGLQPRASVDEARPEPTTSTGLDWDSMQPLQPVAVVTNTTSLNAWQNWLVAAGIFLGIGGALLASLLYEWARPSHAQHSSANDTDSR